jgi:mono/diheme cytochrome c family protein
MKRMLRGLLLPALGVVAMLAGTGARAENLDEGKSGKRLFADSCAACHHGPRGLTKGRFRLTLYLFLQQHYASNSSSAWELASYLESVDDAPHGRSHTAAVKGAPATASRSSSSLRPPASIPQR